MRLLHLGLIVFLIHIAVAETGFNAEELVSKQFGVRIPGSENSQAQYMSFLLE
ncbi:MAG: hypothetical protein JSV25_04380 [Spirochaetota bacterium]|nr:MAG: hypothetical protein JSV25_04380 [Spirochaetota bacterium]